MNWHTPGAVPRTPLSARSGPHPAIAETSELKIRGSYLLRSGVARQIGTLEKRSLNNQGVSSWARERNCSIMNSIYEMGGLGSYRAGSAPAQEQSYVSDFSSFFGRFCSSFFRLVVAGVGWRPPRGPHPRVPPEQQNRPPARYGESQCTILGSLTDCDSMPAVVLHQSQEGQLVTRVLRIIPSM